MNPINHLNPIEQNLCNKADLAGIPIAGNIELTPLCNMACKMCFAKMSHEEMNLHSPIHNYHEWIEIAKQASAAGTIFLLLTGGEPFLYPNIKELYYELQKLGLIISINTNGTLINDTIVEWLSASPPRRLNITLYGASNETYARLCGNPFGFSQVMDAVEKLQAHNISIKFNCSLTPYNIQDLDEIYSISQRLNVPIEFGFYMFPPIRINNISNVQYRLSPEDAAKARFRTEKLRYGNDFNEYIRYSLKTYREYHQTDPYTSGYTCRSGNSVFWINYDGTLSACSFTNDKQIDVFQHGFIHAWETIHEHVSYSKMSETCHFCKMRPLCGRCAAAAISETGFINGIPEYYCELTKSYIDLLEERESANHENQS